MASAVACPPERSGVVDAGLCHGTAGVALLFHRLAEITGDLAAAAAAATWGERLLGEVAADRLPPSPGLLDGRAGVVLALLSLAGLDRGWEAALLVGSPDVHPAVNVADLR
jgi:lantibiotic modifying enzyme